MMMMMMVVVVVVVMQVPMKGAMALRGVKE